MGRPFFVLAPLLLALAGACRARPSAPKAEPVVLRPTVREPRYSSTPARPPEWFEEEIPAIAALLAEEKLEEAMERLHVARASSPGPDDAAEMEEMQRELLGRVLLLRTVRGTMSAPEARLSFHRPLAVRVTLANAGTRDLRIPASPRRTSGSLVEFTIVAREYDISGVVSVRRTIVRLPIERDFDIPAGGTSELTFDLGLAGNDLPLNGFRAYTVRGTLRPARVETGGFVRWETIPLGACEILSFRPNWEQLSDDPPARVGQAIARNAPVHLLTACALLEWNQRADVVDGLIAALGAPSRAPSRAPSGSSGRASGEVGGRMDRVLFTALEHLTGADLGRSAEAWRAWWPRVREDYFRAPSPERDPDRPRFDTPPAPK